MTTLSKDDELSLNKTRKHYSQQKSFPPSFIIFISMAFLRSITSQGSYFCLPTIYNLQLCLLIYSFYSRIYQQPFTLFFIALFTLTFLIPFLLLSSPSDTGKKEILFFFLIFFISPFPIIIHEKKIRGVPFFLSIMQNAKENT